MEASTTLTTLAPPAHDSDPDLRFPQAFEAAAIGIALCQFDGRILDANRALARLLGYHPTELAGLVPWKLHESDSTPSRRLLAELLAGERDFFAVETPCRRKDATQFTGRLTLSLPRNAQHNPDFLIVLVEDSTERSRLEQQLRQAERMEIVGRLTGGIAHDFNNLLTGFLLYCDLLLAKLGPNDPLRRHVDEIRQAGEQGSALTHQLLSFARKQSSRPRPVALNPIIASTENLLRRLIGEHIELLVTLDPNAGQIFADPAQLRQVLLNLVLNARDALKPGGQIRIRTASTNFPQSCQEDSLRPAVSLIVKDNGCGMTPETRAHLFEPFFTTKGPEAGTGLGLATVRRIVTEAGGQIEVATAPGQGTQIEAFFPPYSTACETQPVPGALAEIAAVRGVQVSNSYPSGRSSGGQVKADSLILQSPDDPTTRSVHPQINESPDVQNGEPLK